MDTAPTSWNYPLVFRSRNGYMYVVLIWRVCPQKPISPFLQIFKYGHHRIIQKIIFKMIPRSLHIKNYFWSYDQKYQKFSYYFLYKYFSSFNRKYLNLTKMDLSVFANKLFIHVYSFIIFENVTEH